jgi:ABC-type Fe3+-hydroxamate transport system substrate-binding protein
MVIFVDQLGQNISLPQIPTRIVSLVPSQTELLHYLGLEQEVIGITKFCVHPNEWYRTKERVGGTKNVNIEKIKSLKPDLIIANKEENERAQIEELMRYFPVWVSEIYTLKQALDMIVSVGAMLGKSKEAINLKLSIEQQFNAIHSIANTKKRAAYYIWYKPNLIAGKNTFIDDMLDRCGFENVSTIDVGRYPELDFDKLKALKPDVVLLSSEPFPFAQKQVAKFQKHLPNTKIQVVDGELFSWYGSRLLHSAAYFKQLTDSFS